MKSDKESTKVVELGSIMQVNPKAGLGNEHDGDLGVVQELRTHGAKLQFHAGDIWDVAWDHIEPTGGKVIWNQDGKRMREPKAAPMHHP